MGQPLHWDIKDNRKVTKIKISHDIDPMDKSNWDRMVKIHLDDAEKIYHVFKDRL